MKERKLDAYFTPPEALESLLKYENLSNDYCWEPSCGSGNLSSVLKFKNIPVFSSDIFDYGYIHQNETKDFFEYKNLPDKRISTIITNPPFFCWTKYVKHAISLAEKVIILGKLTILESETRTPVLDTGYFEKCYVFKNRLPMMHREGWEGNKNSSSIAFAWYVFGKNALDEGAIIKRIKCEYDPNKYKV